MFILAMLEQQALKARERRDDLLAALNEEMRAEIVLLKREIAALHACLHWYASQDTHDDARRQHSIGAMASARATLDGVARK
jgi:acyl-CoA reductase-like NAD-dependent aldehyde dehydrogenase